MLFLIKIITLIVIIGYINCINIKLGEKTDTGYYRSKYNDTTYYNWKQKNALHFTIGGKHFFFGMSDFNDGRHWFIQELLENGKVKSETDTGEWSVSFVNYVFPFTFNDKQYIFCMTDANYRYFWFIREILPGGIMGAETATGYWKSAPKVIFPYSVSGGQYVYTISGRNWFITQLLPGGINGRETSSGFWKNYYHLGFPFSINGKTYLYCNVKKYWFIRELLPNGQMGTETDSGYWSTTHKIYVPFNIDDKYYFYGVTSEDYNTRTHWFIQELLPNGKMGAQKAQGSWELYYDVLIAFQIEGKQFLYGHTYHDTYWFIQEIIQEPRLPAMITSSKESYCNDNAARGPTTQYNRWSNQFVQVVPSVNGELNAIEALITQLEADSDNYVTMDFTNPSTPLKSLSTLRMLADANHIGFVDLPVAMRAVIQYRHLTSFTEGIKQEVYDRMRDMDGEYDDEVGHLLASSLGGPTVPFNCAPRSSLVNRAVSLRGSTLPQSGWLALENLLQEFLVEVPDGHIHWSIAVKYGHLPESRRPTEFYVSVRFHDYMHNLINWRGNGAIREYVFPNVPKAACYNLNSGWWHR